jgi:hypothetical protein
MSQAFVGFRIGAVTRFASFARAFTRFRTDMEKIKASVDKTKASIEANNRVIAEMQRQMNMFAHGATFYNDQIDEATQNNLELRTQLQGLNKELRAATTSKFMGYMMDVGASIMYVGMMLQQVTDVAVQWTETFRQSFVDVFGGFAQTGTTADQMREKLVRMSNQTGLKIEQLSAFMSKLAVAGLNAAQAEDVLTHAFAKSMGSSEDMSGAVTRITKEIRKLSENQIPSYISALSLTSAEQDAFNKVLATSEFQTMQQGIAMENLSSIVSEYVENAQRNLNESIIMMTAGLSTVMPIIGDVTGAIITQGPATMQAAGSMLFFASMMKNAKLQGLGLAGAVMSFLPLLLSLPGPLRIAAGAALIFAGTLAAVWAAKAGVEHWTIGVAMLGVAAAGIIAIISGITAAAASLPSYQSGGIVPGVGPQLAVLHGGEQVIPAGEQGFGGGAGMQINVYNYGPGEVDIQELVEQIGDEMARRGGV